LPPDVFGSWLTKSAGACADSSLTAGKTLTTCSDNGFANNSEGSTIGLFSAGVAGAEGAVFGITEGVWLSDAETGFGLLSTNCLGCNWPEGLWLPPPGL